MLKLQSWSMLALALLILFISCRSYRAYVSNSFRTQYDSINELIVQDSANNDYLKVHFNSGDIAVLETWNKEIANDTLKGVGRLFDFNRNEIDKGALAISIADVAIFETNDTEFIQDKGSDVITAMSIMSGFDVALSTVCAIIPKFCFGSCPTFYFDPEEEVQYANAEGFSNAIAPSLQQSDLDALNYRMYGGPISLYLKNEALETHVIDQVQLKVVPVESDEFVYQYNDETFYTCTEPETFSNISGASIHLAEQLAAVDANEYFSVTDSFDLSTKEEIILEFDSTTDLQKGLVINFRQTLLTTFLIYEAISLTGNDCGKFMAQLENSTLMQDAVQHPFDILGAIEVYYFNENRNKWVFVDEIYETGPIARNQEMIVFPKHINNDKKPKIKLRMSKGLWRLDYVGLTSIKGISEVMSVMPNKLIDTKSTWSIPVEPLTSIDDNTFITFPTEEYEIKFDIPNPDQQYELFLESNGYYIEWVRDQWTQEKDLKKLYRMMRNDKDTWRQLAIDFKKEEEGSERLFWSSKVDHLQ